MALRFPSLDYLLSQARNSFLRYPMSILSALLGVVCAIYLIETEAQHFNRFPYINLMLCAALGIPLYFCVALLATRQQFGRGGKILAQVLATLLLLVVYFSLPDAESTHNTSLPYIRYGIYNIIVHLLVSFVPFLFVRQLNGFWNYNKALFLRILSALLYSAFLFAGLAMALLALKILFDVKIEEELFGELFVLIIGLFNTWFFVAGVPQDFEQLEQDTDYPGGLKVFTQYVLFPLLLLYLLILYGYGLKIIISWDWPKGIVSYLIMCMSVLGILTLLLVYPYALQPQNRWIKKAGKGYYLLLLPLLVLLFLAIGMRIADYGVTINRYIIVAVGLWLTFTCLYFLSGRGNIKFVPMSLAGLLILISIGPWSMFSVSEQHQVERLEEILRSGNMLSEGLITREVTWVQDSLPTTFYSPQENQNEGLLNDSLHNEVMSILDYLDDHHGFSSIQPWYRQHLDSMITVADADTSQGRWHRIGEAGVYMRSLGIPYHYKSTDRSDLEYLHYYSTAGSVLDTRGYNRVVFLEELYWNIYDDVLLKGAREGYENTVEAGGQLYQVKYTPKEPGWLTILVQAEVAHTDTLRFAVAPLVEKLVKAYPTDDESPVPADSMSLGVSKGNRSYKLVFDRIGLVRKADSLTLEHAYGKLLIREEE
ncbi:DUF4153 domain-containing protein [Cesiribacter sp. SM1]|uniref:DUF4153 domain-containing protein n=1 Tax=Cesiribacter sp. SM1 TaxID=2861196 RepID=UPI001CD4D590|nr:DUF4153 domain-containing protein [Cesiribacter sp. SM1]